VTAERPPRGGAPRGGAQRIPRPPGSRTGRPAPWAALPEEERHVSLDRVRAAFAGRRPPKKSVVEVPGVRASAVLVPLFDEGGETHVVLTRRAQHLRSHKGEVSFPGGGQDPGEDLRDTALREAHEETGLDPATVEIFGELDHLTTISSRSFIVPYVAALPGRPDLRPNEAEVERILYVPLAELLLDEVFREERWGVPPLDRPITFFEIVGDTIWGATGAMLRQLLAIVTGCEE
jgi:8-oxo-dGTP pyrophosphatase MutT (NUDIX family)